MVLDKTGLSHRMLEKAKELIDTTADIVIIDVPGAANYFVGDGLLDEAIPLLDKRGTYLVCCHVDSACLFGAQKLVDAGVGKACWQEGSCRAWMEAGCPTEP